MRCPRFLRRWIDERGKIPVWVRWLWPHAHWCPDMDYLLVVDHEDWMANCFCRRCPSGKPRRP